MATETKAAKEMHFPGARYIRPGAITVARYGNGRTALLVGDAKLTVNVADGEPMEPDELAIRDYSSGEGTLTALVEAGIVAPPHRFVASGFVDIPICRWLTRAAS